MRQQEVVRTDTVYDWSGLRFRSIVVDIVPAVYAILDQGASPHFRPPYRYRSRLPVFKVIVFSRNSNGVLNTRLLHHIMCT